MLNLRSASLQRDANITDHVTAEEVVMIVTAIAITGRMTADVMITVK
jgi:hypothetical protein